MYNAEYYGSAITDYTHVSNDAVTSTVSADNLNIELRLQNYFDLYEEHDGSYTNVYLKPEYQYDQRDSWLQVLLLFDEFEPDFTGEGIDYNEDHFLARIEEKYNFYYDDDSRERFFKKLFQALDSHFVKHPVGSS